MQSDEASMREERTKRKERRSRKGRERTGKGREGKGREGKGREGKGREGKGREGKIWKEEVSAYLGCKLCLESRLVLPMLLDDTGSSGQFTLQLSILLAHHHVVLPLIRQQG